MAKILVAEDDPVAQKLISTIVTRAGHEVSVSPNGRHAWETMSVTPDIDMLITDVMMPEMDGRELMCLVRDSGEWSGLPILVISAVIGPKAVGGLLDEGATFFLPKPVDRDEVVEIIERCVDPRKRKKSGSSVWKTLTDNAHQTTGRN
jgi:CheY-like chemotaxis protein